ncbi:ABC transporter substrate-binding protein [Nocardia arizonensis]|uniref:ABC transporter substrate-binding protein n=1 Tax=Nocardia arizonensis TaxID=1141647 RepID=UPI0006D2BE48|nr:ABC transporter substrate-binding protein [Nocardia arizonensis]
MASRFWLGIVPKHTRPAPHSWTDWVRIALVVLLVAGASAGYLTRDWRHRLFTCNEGGPSTEAWQVGDRCVGLSDGPYAFGLDAFTHVMGVIDEQNKSAEKHCAGGKPVTVGVLLTMSDELAGSRAVHELEGMAAGQRRANDTGCLHPIRLLVGEVGDYDDDGDPIAVARELAERDEVVAVAGIGLSHESTAEIANLLAAAKIPMVSDVVTAEGFDQNGSRADRPDFERCDRSYAGGIGKDYYYRVGFRVAVQIERIGAVVPRPDFIMVPVGGSDPYTCTALPLLQRRYDGGLIEVKFDTEEPSTVLQTARRVCALNQDVRIAYIARGRDLGRLLSSLDEAYASGQCAAKSITVVSTSDGNRLRTAEVDAALEELRLDGLGSRSFAEGRIRVLFTLVAGARGTDDGTDNWARFEQAFIDAGFDKDHVGDGWAVNAYDALTTIHAALQQLPANAPVQRSQVNTTISGFSGPDQFVQGAGGPIIFDNAGNLTGRDPDVVRLCPPKPSGTTVPTVPVTSQEIPDCPR